MARGAYGELEEGQDKETAQEATMQLSQGRKQDRTDLTKQCNTTAN